MRVALITTWNERCGIAEYAKSLVRAMRHVNDSITFKIFERSWHDLTPSALQDCDVVHLNYEPGLFQFVVNVGTVESWKLFGKKTVLTLHTSHEGNNRSLFTNVFHRVVVHEKTTDGFIHIPMGITPLHEDAYVPLEKELVGTAGFPFPWKGFYEVADATNRLGLRCLVIAPESRHWNTYDVQQDIKRRNPRYEYRTEWMEESEVKAQLARCVVNVFAYGGGNSGISGAVRLGLGSRRPIVISHCRQFRDLFDYPNEVTVIGSSLVEAIQEAISNQYTRYPKRILEDMNWIECARRYEQVYKN